MILYNLPKKQSNGDFIMRPRCGAIVHLNVLVGRTVRNMKTDIVKQELEKQPEGYMYIGIAQCRIGHPIDNEIPHLRIRSYISMFDATQN
jgi:hypothetical protein